MVYTKTLTRRTLLSITFLEKRTRFSPSLLFPLLPSFFFTAVRRVLEELRVALVFPFYRLRVEAGVAELFLFFFLVFPTNRTRRRRRGWYGGGFFFA